MTLNDLKRRNGHYFALFHRHFMRLKGRPKNIVLAIYHLWRHSQGIAPARALKWGTPLSLENIWPLISH